MKHFLLSLRRIQTAVGHIVSLRPEKQRTPLAAGPADVVAALRAEARSDRHSGGVGAAGTADGAQVEWSPRARRLDFVGRCFSQPIRVLLFPVFIGVF